MLTWSSAIAAKRHLYQSLNKNTTINQFQPSQREEEREKDRICKDWFERDGFVWLSSVEFCTIGLALRCAPALYRNHPNQKNWNVTVINFKRQRDKASFISTWRTDSLRRDRPLILSSWPIIATCNHSKHHRSDSSLIKWSRSRSLSLSNPRLVWPVLWFGQKICMTWMARYNIVWTEREGKKAAQQSCKRKKVSIGKFYSDWMQWFP